MSSPLRLTIFSGLATATVSLSLASVFHGAAWFLPVMIAIVLVSGVSALVRWSPLPAALEPILSAVAVTLWITFLDARSVAHLGFIPGRTAFKHLGRTARAGFTDIRKLPTPVPTHHGLVMLSVIAIAAITLIVDLLAVTLRRAALAGLPLLALFTVCAATGHHGVSLLPFIAGAGGFSMLLYADNRERVARWGAALGAGNRARPAPAWSADASGVPGPSMLGGRVGAAAIGVAVVVPLIVPGLHNGIDRHSNGDGFGSGKGGSVSTFNPIVGVGRDLASTVNQPVLTYTSTAANPGYLRLTSLDIYNNGSFSASKLSRPQSANVSNGLPVVPTSTTKVTTSIQFRSNFAFDWMPVPVTALSVQTKGDWLFDPGSATVFSASNTTAGADYQVTSSPDDPTPAQLASVTAGSGQYAADLATPRISPQVVALTHRITASAKSKYDAALEIQTFLTSSRFTYSTSVPADTSADALSNFLLHTRTGFCQQFATSMAVMARVLGIPSRVAVGFTPGQRQPNGSYVVSTHDAHAWPELWFPTYGWLAFEPTPRNDNQTVTPGYAQATPNSDVSKGAANPPAVRKDPNSLTKKAAAPHDASGVGQTSKSGTHHPALSGLDWLFIALALAVAAGLATPGAARVLIRRRRWAALDRPGDGIAAAWAELRDCAVDAGAPWDDGASPRGVVNRLGAWVGRDVSVTDALSRVASAEERDRYAPARPTAERSLRADVEQVRDAMVAPLPRWFRISTVVLPRSVTIRVRRVFSHAADQLQRVETVPGTLARRARARVRTAP
jgi:hypothetical protein